VDRQFAPALELVGDVGATLEALRGEVTVQHTWRSEELAAFRRRLVAFLTPSTDRSELGLSPARLFGRLRTLAPRDTILTVDTGAHKLLIGQVWPSYEPLTYLVSHGLSTMGYALPAAMAAKLEHPGRPVIAVMGDGGLAMVLSELETAARLGLPVVTLVLSDRSRSHPMHQMAALASGVTRIIDFAGICARRPRLPRHHQLYRRCRHVTSTITATVIEVPIDPTDYLQML
jgi:acetolactate synthase-1/2/3 large subunit